MKTLPSTLVVMLSISRLMGFWPVSVIQMSGGYCMLLWEGS